MRIFKQKKRVKRERPELQPDDSEFNPTRSKLDEDKITETLSNVDNVLSNLNKHNW